MRWSIEDNDGEAPILSDDDVAPTVVIFAHGAGGHMEQATVERLAGLIRQSGASVVRFNFLYKAQGRSMPDRMPVLMRTYHKVIDAVRDRLKPQRLVIGGHSMGGRTASMIEAEHRTADGLLLCGYPLHPAGQPEKLRKDHLPNIVTPTLQINGTEDPLCTKELMDPIAAALSPEVWRLKWIDGADHSYAVKKSSGRSKRDVDAEILESVSEWLRTIR